MDMSVAHIQKHTYPNHVFYQHRFKVNQELVSHDTIDVMSQINEELRKFTSTRKKNRRTNLKQSHEKWRVSKPVIFKKSDDKLEEYQKKCTTLLNKLSHPNVTVITTDMIKVFTLVNDQCEMEECIEFISLFVKTLYQKALREPLFYQDYVYLLNHIIKSDFESNFTSMIVNHVKTTCDFLIECLLRIVNSDKDEATGDDTGEEMFDLSQDHKGFCRFLSELYLHQHIPLPVISNVLDELQKLYSTSTDSCSIIEKIVSNYCNICYPLIKSEYFPIETYIQPLHEWSANKNIPSKTRFLIADLIEEFESID